MNNNTYQKINLDVLPACEICADNDGVYQQAEFIAAQSANKGDSISWVCICRGHRMGWNEGGDWDAPIFRIAQQPIVGD